jgi:hypothetical protein
MSVTIEQRGDEVWLVLSDGAERKPCYALVYALGGRLRGFRPVEGRFESRLTFKDGDRAAGALPLLRLAFDESAAPSTGWCVMERGAMHSLMPNASCDDASIASLHLLAALLDRPDGTARGIEVVRHNGNPVGVTAADPQVARWLARALAPPRPVDPGPPVAPPPANEPVPASLPRRRPLEDPGGCWRERILAALRFGCLSPLWSSDAPPIALVGRSGLPSEIEREIESATLVEDYDRAIHVWSIAAALVRFAGAPAIGKTAPSPRSWDSLVRADGRRASCQATGPRLA